MRRQITASIAGLLAVLLLPLWGICQENGMLNMEENIAALARAKSELAKRFNIQSLEVRATTVPE
jgi:hypothetical protein